MTLIGAYAGASAGAIMVFFSHVAPRFRAANFIRDIDRTEALGKEISRREAHLIGILIHLVLATASGAMFAFGVDQGWATFTLLPILGFSVLFMLFTGLIIMPLEGHGFFGVKHDAWFAVDSLLTNIIWGFLYLILIRIWLPV